MGTVYENTVNFKAQEGDIVVFNDNYGAGNGHVAVVLNGNYDGNYMQFVSLDNNWQSGGWTSGPAQGGKVGKLQQELYTITISYVVYSSIV